MAYAEKDDILNGSFRKVFRTPRRGSDSNEASGFAVRRRMPKGARVTEEKCQRL